MAADLSLCIGIHLCLGNKAMCATGSLAASVWELGIFIWANLRLVLETRLLKLGRFFALLGQGPSSVRPRKEEHA
jgi:hypothetical protein